MQQEWCVYHAHLTMPFMKDPDQDDFLWKQMRQCWSLNSPVGPCDKPVASYRLVSQVYTILARMLNSIAMGVSWMVIHKMLPFTHGWFWSKCHYRRPYCFHDLASMTSWKVLKNLPYTMYIRWVEFYYGTSILWSLPVGFHARMQGQLGGDGNVPRMILLGDWKQILSFLGASWMVFGSKFVVPVSIDLLWSTDRRCLVAPVEHWIWDSPNWINPKVVS